MEYEENSGENKDNEDNKDNNENNLNDEDPNNPMVSFNDVNYAIYKIGNWKNKYKINLIGISDEIPVTESTKDHVLGNMKEIRNSIFEMNDEKVNGIVGLSIQLNPLLKKRNLKDIIAEEEKEYKNIVKEIDELELEDPNDSILLENNKFLIYKLEKDHHVTVAKPANSLTLKHHAEEIVKLKELSNAE